MKKLQAISPDRISALPEPIIHHILLRLPTKSVKLATSLSKTWYDFCSSFPYLDFEDFSFESMYYEEIIDYQGDFNPDLKPQRERYLNFIGETLRRFHQRNPGILIRRLKIPITLINPRFVSLFGNWIRLALEHGVEKIDLLTRGYYFNLPREVFASSSIRVLKLLGCGFLESFRNGDIRVSNSKLRKLDIAAVDIDELALRSVISNFPLMEKLKIAGNKGLADLCISRLCKLKSLVVSNPSGDIKMVEVHAPVLHYLELYNNLNCPLYKIGILECPRLAKLILYHVEVENDQLEEILSKLPLLRSLSLTELLLLTKFKISNDSLEELAVIKCTNLVELEINAPNLLSFKFDSNSAPLVGPKHTIMGQSHIKLGWEPLLYDNFAVKFRNFLSRLEHVNYVCLYLHDLDMISVDELEESVVPPLTNIKELKIMVIMQKNLQDIFNGLLWSYNPRTLTMKLVLVESDDAMTFLRAITGVDSCCSSVYARNWRPYVEEITIVVGDDNVIKLPMDGTVPSIALEHYLPEIKFAFKW